MSSWTINSEPSLQSFMGDVRQLFRENKYVKLTAKVGKARSLDQNAISHAWYEQIARELREDDTVGWKSYCKLHHGIPILRAEDEEFRQFYDGAIKGLIYEQKLQAMKFMPVTSLMTRPQLSKYLEAVQDDFQNRGVYLMFPEIDRTDA
ncbi:hypothetical protein UFOVP1155_11 [uncultured Caudovirales phage]|uniref:Uncharacterized protein n=1 Tax=uncultured Caudovirales phage TaxID=2100421 RepID=A0A6J5QXI3_9CAUD|nr:hypothetical protein UFOVP1155_11 [uncultured Caudovirales phage]